MTSSQVYSPKATQEQLFEGVEPTIMSCVDGYNVCIIAYVTILALFSHSLRFGSLKRTLVLVVFLLCSRYTGRDGNTFISLSRLRVGSKLHLPIHADVRVRS